ncbi:hypothetical protein EGR_10533 [Echinococcus granulosus]|uniref:Uncharacterized protein n=1 Tax=Echinococcus granulosus TaxID=6210 RepID=W6U885_ECHGR|nr:hypothetical protein EGR_10533 [Echinococcus granulosus]EUB54612.1 hypothetical protein EGR_10533 [Echinococcus granulosus]
MWSGRRPRKHSGCRDPSKTCEAATNCLLITTPKVAKKWRLASRVVYIGGATLLTCAILLEGIFVRLLLVPYLREADFKPTLCVLHNTFYEVRAGLQRCESRCAKLASAFPCLVVRVRFLQPHDRSWHTGYLFDQLLSYQKRQPHFVRMKLSQCWLSPRDESLEVTRTGLLDVKCISSYYLKQTPNNFNVTNQLEIASLI